MTTNLLSVHPFSHIMDGPYSYAGYFDSSTTSESNLGECIGSCDHCNTAISYAVYIKGANGTFKVGETCATKIDKYEPLVAKLAKDAGNKRRTEARKAKVTLAFDEAFLWVKDNLEYLQSQPHPKGFSGNAADYLEWYYLNSGKAKFVDVVKSYRK